MHASHACVLTYNWPWGGGSLGLGKLLYIGHMGCSSYSLLYLGKTLQYMKCYSGSTAVGRAAVKVTCLSTAGLLTQVVPRRFFCYPEEKYPSPLAE